MNHSQRDSDEVLVTKLQKGDKTALVPLVQKWHKLFCDKAYWLVKDKDAAKDIAQDSWVIIIHKLNGLKEPGKFKYWAFRIVYNKATDWLRLQSKNQERNVSIVDEVESEPHSNQQKDIIKQKLLKSIQDLPFHQKTIVRLFYTESYSLKQISELLNISIGTAKSRLFHARENLKKELNNIKNKY